MRRRSLLVLISLVLIAGLLFAWQLPNLLKALPSRYVARLPQPVQTMGARYQGELLPTAATTMAFGDLIDEDPISSATAERIPATPTPPPTTAANVGTVTDQTSTDARVSAASTATATAETTPTPVPTAPIPVSHTLSGIEHRIQTWNNCGPATLSMTLSYFELHQTQTQIADAIKPDPEDRNVTPGEMVAYVNGSTNLHAINRINGDLSTIRRLLSEDVPVIVEYGLQPENEYRWLEWMGHYLLITSYDDNLEQVRVYDSWPRTGEIPDENFVFEPLVLDYEVLDRNWRAFNRAYIAVYTPDQADTVAEIIGEDMDEATMWQNALATVQSELRDEPDDPFLWFNLGTILNAREDYERAAAAFDQARAIGLPWRMLWYQFGPYEAYYQTGRYEEVVMLTEITLRDRPYFEESYYYQALAQIELGQLQDARDNLQKAVDFNPNFAPAKTALEALELASN